MSARGSMIVTLMPSVGTRMAPTYAPVSLGTVEMEQAAVSDIQSIVKCNAPYDHYRVDFFSLQAICMSFCLCAQLILLQHVRMGRYFSTTMEYFLRV